ncbi:MAG: hypothetical protein EHM64_05395 [Ignavibacteriae bacterium]|nr:MAG: hypothetical protein EHM64_05395 [Ignavibacteriota bacterium]
MKHFLILLLVCSTGTLYAQNPDGHGASLHITPSLLWGTANYDRYAPLLVPQTQVTPSYFTTVRDTGIVHYPSAFGIDVMLKIPAASSLTVNVAYSYSQLFEEINTPLNVNNAFYYWSLKGARHKISVTASIYNLFSIY